MSIIQELTGNVLETRFESFDKDTVERAKLRVLDAFGCIIGGAGAPGCQMAVDLVKKWGGEAESTIPVYGVKAPAHNVAMVNSVMCRSYDYEPVEPNVHGVNVPAHVSGTTVPTGLAVAEMKGASGKELITALILGDDLTSRIIAASCFSFDKGWDVTGTVNVFGATAIAGRLLKLDEARMLNAFGITLNQMAGSFQGIYDGAHCFKLPMGLASRAGVFSAELAGLGFTGIQDPLLSKHGYFSLYCRDYDPEILTRDLGRKFFADSTFKPYPACRSTHAAIECALQLAHTHDIIPENIESITVDVTAVARDMFVGQPFRIGEVPQANASFNLQYTVATTLLRKSIKLEYFTVEFILEPSISDLVKRVKITGTLPPERPLAAAVAVIMKNGNKYNAYVEIPRGDMNHRPITREDIKEKFRDNIVFSQKVPGEKAEKALDMIEALEEVKDVTEIIRQIA